MKNAAVILNSDDLMLSGEVYIPNERNKSFPAVCLCHGIPAVPYDPNEKNGYSELAARFCRAGFVALIFNFRGAGPSQGNIDMVGWTHDLASAIEFLDMLPEVDKKKICLLGSSGGAAVSIYSAAFNPKVAAVVTLACPAEFNFWGNEFSPQKLVDRFREIGIIKDPGFPPSIDEWLQGFETIKPIDYVDKIAPRPLLLIHGDKDEVVPVDHVNRLYAKAGQPKEVVILEGGVHRLRNDERAVDKALKWLLDKMS
jgi:uncharacterized protein